MQNEPFNGGTKIKPGEKTVVLLSFSYFFFLLASYYILRPLRDEMGIRGGVENLQWLFTGTFASVLLAVPAYHFFVSRVPKRAFLTWVYRFFILNILLFWLVFRFHLFPVGTARVFFIWTSTFNLFVVSVFWSFMVDLFDKEQSRRLFGLIAAGGTAGALTGPSITILLAAPLGPVNLLLISAVFLELAVQCILRLLRFAQADPEKPLQENKVKDKLIGGGTFSGIKQVFQSSYLLSICGFLLLMTLCNTFFYFTQAGLVSDAFAASADRTSFFAAIDLLVNMLTILLQLFLTARLLTRWGTALGLALLPAMTFLGFLCLSVAPVLAVIMTFQVLRRGINYSINHPAREGLFTIVSDEQKYKSKNFLDTVVYRGGDAASGWVFRILAAALTGTQIMLVGALAALLWIFAGTALGRRHDKTHHEPG